MFHNPYCLNDKVSVKDRCHCCPQRKGLEFLSHIVTTKRATTKRAKPKAATKD
tara:strand:- start:1159 stop:1317 length:159 start_codon:yes stop_codon:yes gene_type:complete